MTAAIVAVCAVAGLLAGAALEIVIDRVPQRESLLGWSRRDLNTTRAATVVGVTVALFVGLAVRYHDS